jgi:AcrR family transcriptional regulator
MVNTRQQILEKNFHAIHLNGFQGTRTDKVIADLGITKGAFYHYFPDKLALGYAVLDEMVAPMYIGMWQKLDNYEGNPIDGICEILEGLIGQCDEEAVKLGCPLNNLMQEMAPLDEGFRTRLNYILNTMQKHIARAIKRGQQENIILSTINAESLAFYILSSFEGGYGIAKSLQSREVFESSFRQLIQYLQTLKV